MVLDLIIISIIVICAIVNLYRGFFRSVITLAGFCVALVVGAVSAPWLGGYIEPGISRYFESYTGASIADFLADFNVSASSAATVFGFAVGFFAVVVICWILIILSKFLLKLPVLKQADQWLGLALGTVAGILGAWVVSIILFNCSELLIRMFDSFDASMFEGSVVAKWFYEHNLFKFIMNLT